MRLFCLAAFLAALVVLPLCVAHADTSSPHWPGLQCQWYFSDSADLPDDIAKLQAFSRSSAIKVCIVRSTQSHGYFTAGVPHKSAAGVCWYRLNQFFRDEREKAGWNWTPPDDYKFPPVVELYFGVFDGECPRADSASYIVAHDMSEGVFLAFWRFWKEAAASPEALDQIMDERIKRSTAFARFKEALGDPRLNIAAISSVQSRENAIVYSLDINDFRYARTSWSIEFDLTTAGFKILDMRYGSE